MKNNWIITFIFVCIFAGNSAGIVLANEEDDDAKKSKRGSWFSSLFEDDDDDDDDEHGERRRSSGKQGSKMSPVLASISAAPPEFERMRKLSHGLSTGIVAGSFLGKNYVRSGRSLW